MEKRRIGNTDMYASKIALGTWSMGGDRQWGAQDENISLRAIRTAVEHGVNLLDTAPAYGFGKSEQLIGKVLKELPRDKVLVQTKVGIWWRDDEGALLIERDGKVCRRNLSRRAIMEDVDISLKNLGTDYIDIYITHQQSREPFLTPVSETMDALLELKKQGKIRAIGISNCTKEEFGQYVSCGTIDVVQEKNSMLDSEKKELFLNECERRGITFEAFSPLEQGLLSGKIGMDYQIPKGNIREKSVWFQKDRRRKVLEMLKKWEPLCKKYECSMASLVTAWTAQQSDHMIVIGGGRKEQHVLEYINGGKLMMEKSDTEKMTEEIEYLKKNV